MEGRNKLFARNRDFHTPLLVMVKVTRQKINKRGPEHHNKPIEQYIKNTVLDNRRIHILLKCTRDSFQDRLSARPQINSQEVFVKGVNEKSLKLWLSFANLRLL